jgi:thymidine kinase
MGSLTVIFGPMFSGKTTRLIQELTRFMDVTNKSHNTKCLLINHIFDTRNEAIGISSHGSSFKGISDLIDITKTSNIDSVDVDSYDVIGVDEAQFFENLEIVYKWICSDKIVIISGLIADAFMKPFGKINTLITSADNIIQCHAICSECIKNRGKIITPDALAGMKAPFTFRIVSSNEQISIGASDKYIPVCRYHYNSLSNKTYID